MDAVCAKVDAANKVPWLWIGVKREICYGVALMLKINSLCLFIYLFPGCPTCCSIVSSAYFNPTKSYSDDIRKLGDALLALITPLN